MTASAPKAPKPLGPSGRSLWQAVTEQFELEQHEVALLTETCRCVDALDALDEVVRRDGVLVSSPQGEKASPALVEARVQRLTLARLVAALRLPEDDADERPQRRGAPRGVYGPRGVA